MGVAMLENPKYKNGFEKGTPYTIVGAKPGDFEPVENKRVIHVTNRFYRDSFFSGTFELQEQKKSPFIETLKGNRVKILCYWFCCKPKSAWLKMLLRDAEFTIEEGYSGPVARNIEK